MFSYIKNKNSAYGLQSIVADDTTDIKDLPKNVAMGSTCLVLSTGKIYRINSKGEWLLQPASGGTGGDPATLSMEVDEEDKNLIFG